MKRFIACIILLPILGYVAIYFWDFGYKKEALSWVPFELVPQRWGVIEKRILKPRDHSLSEKEIESRQQHFIVCLGEDTRKTYSFLVSASTYSGIGLREIFSHEDVKNWERFEGIPEVLVLRFEETIEE